MTSIAPRGVGIWGAPLHGAARAEWFASVPPQEYNRKRLQGANRNRVPSGRAPIGPRAPSASLPSGAPSARASWSQPTPPEKYNTRRLVGANTKRVPDSHPRTPASVAALMQGETPAGLVSKMGALPRMANVTEVMAGLRAALDTSADDKERAHIGDLIETLRPITVIAARRALTPEEQAIVDQVAQTLLGEAHEEVAAQAGEERAHQAARAAEFSEIEEVAKTKGAATDAAKEARARVAGMAAAAESIARDIEGIARAKEAGAQATAAKAAAIDRNAAAVRAKLDELESRAAHTRAEAKTAGEESHRARARAGELQAEAERLAREAAERAKNAAHERKLGWDEVGARAMAEDAERLVAESAQRASEAAAEADRVNKLGQAGRKAAREARKLDESATKVRRKGTKLERARVALDKQFQAGVDGADRATANAEAEMVEKLQEAAAADEEAKEIEARAEAVPEPGKPRLPEKSQRTRRRARAAAAREAEDARAVGIISQGVRGGVLRAAPGQAAEPEEERKEPARALPEVPEIPEGLDLRGYTKTGTIDLMKALGVRGHSRVKSADTVEAGIAEGLRLLQAAEAQGGRGAPKPGTLTKVLENIRTGGAMGVGIKFPRAPQ